MAHDRRQRDEWCAALAGPVALVSIGAVCTATARSLGLEPHVQPARHRLGAMVHELARYAGEVGERDAVDVDGARVVVRAAAAVVDGEVIDLAERERDVLAALVARPGAVVSKDALLERLWPPGTEAHTVEVTVGRLRRRLAGRLAVVTVPRRGYRVAHRRAAAV
jgi:uroporphyrinogen-III synthase